MPDALHRAVAPGRPYRVAAADTTDLVREAILRHGPRPTGALALARALTVVALASILDKHQGRLSMQWLGRGDLGTLTAEFRTPGDLRGYLTGAGDSSDVAEGFGAGGLLSVIRQQESGAFTQGQVALADKSVDGDVEAWLQRSDQVPSALRVFVERDDEGYPRRVGGLLVQALPGGTQRELNGLLAPGFAGRELPDGFPDDPRALAALVPGLELEWLEEAPLRFHCTCNPERVQAGVRLLGAAELQEMIDEGEEPEVHCDWCSVTYRVDVDALKAILADLLETA